MTKVLSLQKKFNRLVKQGIKYLDQCEALIRSKAEPERPVETKVTFNVQKISQRFVKKFGATSCVYRATMEHPKEGRTFGVKDILTELSSLFTDVIDKVLYKHIGIWFYCNGVPVNHVLLLFVSAAQWSIFKMLTIAMCYFYCQVKDQCDLKTLLEDKIRVMVRSNALKTPISTRLLPAIQMTVNKVLAEVTKVLQSNEHVPLDQSFTVDVVAIKQPTGSGKVNKKSLKVLDYAKDTLVKKSIITIRNKDNLCCGRALAVGQALADNHPKLKQIRNGRAIQKKLALDLYQKANVLPDPCGLREVSKFQGVTRL